MTEEEEEGREAEGREEDVRLQEVTVPMFEDVHNFLENHFFPEVTTEQYRRYCSFTDGTSTGPDIPVAGAATEPELLGLGLGRVSPHGTAGEPRPNSPVVMFGVPQSLAAVDGEGNIRGVIIGKETIRCGKSS